MELGGLVAEIRRVMNKPGRMIAINRIIKTRRSVERRRRTLGNVRCVCNGISLIKVKVRMSEVQKQPNSRESRTTFDIRANADDMRRFSQNRYRDVANMEQHLRAI